MWNYEKRLQYPVKITQTNPKIAQIILSQFGGPDGELGASLRYFSQRYTMPYNEVIGTLTDIATEESAQKWYQLVSYYIGRYSFLYQSICSRIQHCCQPHQHLCIQNSIFFQLSYIHLFTISCSNPSGWNLHPNVITDRSGCSTQILYFFIRPSASK